MNLEEGRFLFNIKFVRDSWINIFVLNGYKVLGYESLIPSDNSLLWINSGVAAVKKYFTNLKEIKEFSFVNCQKVVRFNDINNINSNSRHQTLFEMLGVFSAKNEKVTKVLSIVWQWFVSPEWLNLDKNKIFITVWEDDYETKKFWESLGVSKKHIFSGSREQNFWDMGDGPCGPNTEIFYFNSSLDDLVSFPSSILDLEGKNFVELCNVVFSNSYNEGNFVYRPLEKYCLDIGAGLERICMVLQNKKNTFEIDVWEDSLKIFKDFLKEEIFFTKKTEIYTAVDHLRTLCFSLAEDIHISSKGRGYVLKKLLKKVCFFSFFLKVSWEIINKVVLSIIKINSSFYKELNLKKDKILENLFFGFSKEIDVIEKNYVFLSKEDINTFNAEKIFFLYDTKGIPLQLIRSFLVKNNIQFPEISFNSLLELQKEKGRINREKKNIKVFS